MSTRSTSRRIRSAAVLPPVLLSPPSTCDGGVAPQGSGGQRPRTNWALARHIIAHEIRMVDAAIFAVALIATLVAMAVLL